MAKAGKGSKTRAIRIRGKMPSLANVPPDVLRRAMPRVVERVTEQAKTEAPQGRGESSSKSLVRRITGKVEREGERGVVRSNAPHSHLIEFGVKPHSLTPGSGKRRKRKGFKAMRIYGDPAILRRGAWHGGHGKNPFLERAIPNSETDVNRILQQEGNRALAEAVSSAVESLDGLF